MQSEGLIQNISGEYKATKKGVQLLHKNIRELKEFVDKAMERLDIVDVCAAIAKTPIKKGEKVGLFMEKGFLTAYSNKPSKSTGIAMSEVQIGDDLAIKDLEGVIELSFGEFYIIELPSIRDGGTHKISVEKVKKIYSSFKPDKIGALDIIGFTLLNKLGLKCDFEFAPINPVIEAVQKGLNVMVIGSTDNVHKMTSIVNEINTSSLDKIEYKLISFVK